MSRRKRLVMVLAASTLGWATPLAGQTAAPELRLRASGEELLSIAYPERYGGDPEALIEDVEWVEDEAADLREWWERQGATLLLRAADMAGLPWPYRDIEV